MMKTYIAKPFDVLFFRNNKPFSAGEWFTEGIFPPYPSTFQGLIRTAILAHNDHIKDNGQLKNAIDSKNLVGDNCEFPFNIKGPYLHGAYDDKGHEDLFLPTPKDIVIPKGDNIDRAWQMGRELDASLKTDAPLRYTSEKPKDNFLHYAKELIRKDSLKEYLRTGELSICHLEYDIPCEEERHHGIALSHEETRTTREGQFYLTPYNRLHPEAGFAFSIETTHENKPEDADFNLNGLWGRLGSEARGVAIETADIDFCMKDKCKYTEIAKMGLFKIVLLTPGIFPDGWRPFGDGQISLLSDMNVDNTGLELKLITAINESPLSISGYSMVARSPNGRTIPLKKQIRANPPGSVYYYKIEGYDKEDIDAREKVAQWLESIDDTKLKFSNSTRETSHINNYYAKMGFNHIAIGIVK